MNPGFPGCSVHKSMVKSSFSPDGAYVFSGGEDGRLRVWEARSGKRVRLQAHHREPSAGTGGQSGQQAPPQASSQGLGLGLGTVLSEIAWHPSQHVIALVGQGQDAPLLLYYGLPSGMMVHPTTAEGEDVEGTREGEAVDEEQTRRMGNRQRLRELRMKRLRDKACLLYTSDAADE